MNILGMISNLVTPVTKLIDDLHTSEEEKQQAKEKIYRIQSEIFNQAIDYEKMVLKQKAEIVNSEIKGESWLQRNWRPITMMTFLVLVVSDSFGILAFRLSEEAWTLLQWGMGGYVASRGVEKVVPNFSKK